MGENPEWEVYEERVVLVWQGVGVPYHTEEDVPILCRRPLQHRLL